MLVHFNYGRLTDGRLIQKQTGSAGSRMSLIMGKHEKFRKLPFIYAPSRSVSLLTSVLIFQTAITAALRSVMSRYFCLVCNSIW